ncbi:MAG: 16S rRNA (cytosine(1402)-N(4))-methyltransferase [Betaproteobacteria bacterium RIFCSPLOWO2_12_FULL_62_13b]|nr:MAG: 16S rRNA (cytosine(1402)-N(4))-methyltransferase [Betaproteobacteria bacterium RIFCSPLOWO2_12_FULL_62_13b]
MPAQDSHKTVLLEEAVDALAIRPDGAYVDATFGRGGHSRLILGRLGRSGRLVALDRDAEAVAVATRISDARFSVVHASFAELAGVLERLGLESVDGVLLDLGVSSPQLDDAARGFSFRRDGPLDMRMDTSRGQTAAQWLGTAGEAEIREVIRDYGEERFAKQIAKAIVAARQRQPVVTTGQLADIVGAAVRTREKNKDPATRTFQAVRIYLNQELAHLSLALPQILELLKPGARLAVISFHSLEDRIVKRFMRDAARADVPIRLPLRARELPQPRLRLIGKPVRPSAEEVAANPRARSATLRVAERSGA